MMRYCRDKAREIFDRVIKMGPGEDEENYWRTCWQKVTLLWQAGWNQQNVDEYLPLVEAGSNKVQEWICLIHAYDRNDKCDAAWEWAQRAVEKFPESAMLHIYCGDLCKALGRYEEAFFHWQRAKEMEPTWMDSWYAMGFCYEELEDYEKAVQMWESISDDLAARGFEEEVLWPRERARHCREKIQQ
jgi:tetratricopeptide (TPR) repeat protein